MKILLFTHSQDIDGMGCIILAKEAFSNQELTFLPCKTFEITSKVNDFYQKGLLKEYDLIFVTDLCIKEPLLSIISSDTEISSKFRVLDHHKTEIKEGNNKYSFVDIIVEQNGIKECGTSLFYKYLLANNFLESTPFYDCFVELTRQYDVWDWKAKNNQNARNLNILFECLGTEEYLAIINSMKNNNEICFNNRCQEIIDLYNCELKVELEKIYLTLKIQKILIEGNLLNIGFVDTKYKFRNEIPEFIKMKNACIDVIGMNIIDGETISYRCINENIDCSKIAEMFGGKGHKNAASNPKDNAKFKLFMQENFNKEL